MKLTETQTKANNVLAKFKAKDGAGIIGDFKYLKVSKFQTLQYMNSDLIELSVMLLETARNKPFNFERRVTKAQADMIAATIRLAVEEDANKDDLFDEVEESEPVEADSDEDVFFPEDSNAPVIITEEKI